MNDGIKITATPQVDVPVESEFIEEADRTSQFETELPPNTIDFEEEHVEPVARNTASSAPALVAEAGEIDIPTSASMEDDEVEVAPVSHQHAFQEDVFLSKDIPQNSPAMALPTMSFDEIAELLGVTSKILSRLSPEQLQGIGVHGSSIGLTEADGVYKRFFDRPGSKLVQTLKTADGIELRQTTPAYKPPKKGDLLDLADASAYAARLVQAYDTLYIIGHHSGMWLKVTVPRGRDIHRLLGEMITTRGELGYATRGATLSSDTALRNMAFVNFVIERAVATNMVDSSPESIRRNLVALDIPLLAQQMASAIHPSGFAVERACSTKPGTCGHVEREWLRLSKIQHVDSDRFTPKQMAHMQTLLKRAHRKTDADMAAYRNEFGANIIRRVEIAKDIWVTFQPPSVEVYEDTAEEWAAEIKRESENVLQLMTEDQGRRHMEQQASLTVMSKYSAWVVEINMDGRLVEERMAIRAVLGQLSEHDEIVKRFTDGVSNYISDCTVAAVGVSDYRCPVCNGKQTHAETGFMSAIAPLDAVTAFFTLAQLKIQLNLSNDSVG